MKDLFINNSLNLVRQYYPEYTEEKLAEIEYGLLSIYLTITKLIVISIVACLLNIFIESLIFTILYNIIRTPSFGLHATKSWICLLSSTIIFIGMPFICKYLVIPKILILILGTIGILLVFKNSPADTEKRPIISRERRQMFRIISTIIAIIMVVIALYVDNYFLSNSLIAVILIQSFIISPFAYSLFNFPYDNYKNYVQIA